VSQNKTTATRARVETFLQGVKDPRRRADALQLTSLLKSVSGHEPVMWGPSIVGFGTRHYRYETGREGDTPAVSFSPRSNALALYIAQVGEWPRTCHVGTEHRRIRHPALPLRDGS
jgi:hypothetical protein